MSREARRGAGRQAEMAENFEDHRRIFDPCPELLEEAAMTFKAPPQFGQGSMSILSGANTVLESFQIGTAN